MHKGNIYAIIKEKGVVRTLKMKSLKFLIDMLTKGRRLHISILDVNGILNTPKRTLDFENVIHSKEFCRVAKSSERGMRLCLYCKKLANTKAITEKVTFSGHCSYGLYEAAVPVVIGGTVAAVVYVGNAITDPDKTYERIEKSSRYTRVDKEKLYLLTGECERIDNEDELLGIAEIISDYIKALYVEEPKARTQAHWLVTSLKQYADSTYLENPTLKELSILYHKNEKYMGRLFKRDVGVSFHEYCLSLKLERAAKLLMTTNDKTIDIALDCGFNNISYFNRAFKKQHGVTPNEYRVPHAR